MPRWLLVLLPLLASGCATAMYEPPRSLPDPWEQRALAGMLESGLHEVHSEFSGRAFRVEVVPARAFFSRYAREALEEGIWDAGGEVRPDAPALVAIEVLAAGGDRSDRNLAIAVGQYIRLPLYYGQDDTDALRARLRLETPGRTRVWDLSAVRKSRSAYAFRIFGPFDWHP